MKLISSAEACVICGVPSQGFTNVARVHGLEPAASTPVTSSGRRGRLFWNEEQVRKLADKLLEVHDDRGSGVKPDADIHARLVSIELKIDSLLGLWGTK